MARHPPLWGRLSLKYETEKSITEAILSTLVPIWNDFCELGKDQLYKQEQIIAGSSPRSVTAMYQIKQF